MRCMRFAVTQQPSCSRSGAFFRGGKQADACMHACVCRAWGPHSICHMIVNACRKAHPHGSAWALQPFALAPEERRLLTQLHSSTQTSQRVSKHISKKRREGPNQMRTHKERKTHLLVSVRLPNSEWCWIAIPAKMNLNIAPCACSLLLLHKVLLDLTVSRRVKAAGGLVCMATKRRVDAPMSADACQIDRRT